MKFRILVLLILSFEAVAFGQTNNFFEHIGPKEGLTHNRIESLAEDKNGFLWIATAIGVFRYDGKTFKLYEDDVSSLNSSNPSSAYQLTRDAKGNIWVGGNTSLHFYNDQRDTFYAFQPDSIRHIVGLYGDSKNNIWVGSQNSGLFRFDQESHTFRSINEEYGIDLPVGAVTELIEDDHDNLWFSYPNGIHRLNLADTSITYFKLREELDVGYNDALIKSLYKDEHGIIWMGSSAGIFFVDNVSKSPELLPNSRHLKFAGIGKGWDGKIWASTWDGQIYSIHQTLDKTNSYLVEENIPELKDENQIQFLNTRDGNLWVGTGFNYLFHWSPFLKSFTGYREILGHKINFPDFLEDEKGNILISNNSGLVILDPNENTFFYNFISEGITSGMMARDSSNWIWVASWVGLSKFNIDRHEIINYFPDSKNPKSIPGISVPFVFIDYSGTVWVSVWSKGLYRYRRASDDFEYLPLPVPHEKGYNVRTLYQDPLENIFLATDSHLYKLDKNYEVKKVQNFGGINAFWSVSPDQTWIGSERGIFLIDNQDSIKDLADETGLAGFRVKSILGDDSGNLWLGTQKGLIRYNIKGHLHHLFTIDDGLPGNIFLPACLRTNKGELYFSLSDGGVLRFHPDSIRLNDNIPKIVITSLKNQNQEIKIQNISNSDSENNYNSTYKDLELKWFQNDLSVSFAALNFTSPQKNQYRYKLENYDSDWNYADQKNNQATYTNLDPGKYTFHVIGSNSDGVWNEEGVRMNISILPPWYWNTFSKFIYLLLIGLVLWYVRRYEKNREKLRYALEVEKVRSEELEEVDQLKTRFFNNISHELKTPITLITGPVKELIKRNRKEDKRYLHIIQGNAERLRSLVDQLLDLAKIDARKLSLQAREIDFISFSRKIFEFYIPAAEEKDIRFLFKTNLISLPLYFDPDKMEKIINNLLSNAFKFTPRGKEIVVHIACEDQDAHLSVIDSGPGISENDLPKIFDRFFQADNSQSRSYEGTGIGLALARELTELHHGTIEAESTLDKGTRIEIILPLGKEHLTPEEIVSQDTGVSLTTSRVGHYGKTAVADPIPVLSPYQLPTVLIVEDNEDMRGYLKLLLAEKYQILESDNGDLALQVARDVIPDLIVSDVMMPKMTGFDFCEQIKSDMLTCHIPILLLTVKSDLESRLESFKKGADAYLSKPFESEELVIRLEALLASKQRIRDFYQSTTSPGDESNMKEAQDPLIRNLNDLVYENMDDSNFGIAQICRKMGISRAQLYRKVEALTGQPVGLYINTIKLNRAFQLLRTTTLNISEIAYSVGYKDPAYFSRQFKKTFGKSPSEFREQ